VSLANPLGTAPGVAWDLTSHVGHSVAVLCFPGVPKEMKAIWPAAINWLQPWRAQQLGELPQTLFSRQVRFAGIGESLLVEKLEANQPGIMNRQNPTVAPYCGAGEVRIRVAVKAASEAEANPLLLPVIETITQSAPEHLIGLDETTLEAAVGEQLRQHRYQVAVAESCTGGLVSSRLTDVPGSSDYVSLNVVTYANAAKTKLLEVPQSLLAEHGAVSVACAQAMVRGLKELTQAEALLAVTGIAGPGGASAEKPIGLVYVATWLPANEPEPTVQQYFANRYQARADLKYNFSQLALLQLLTALRKLS
jgi:nicotinamide-nucleotide amidase